MGHAWANITVVADHGARVGPYAIREAPNEKMSKNKMDQIEDVKGVRRAMQ